MLQIVFELMHVAHVNRS